MNHNALPQANMKVPTSVKRKELFSEIREFEKKRRKSIEKGSRQVAGEGPAVLHICFCGLFNNSK